MPNMAGNAYLVRFFFCLFDQAVSDEHSKIKRTENRATDGRKLLL